MNCNMYIAMSLDGFIADTDGSVDWLDKYNNIDCGYADFVKNVDCVVMGSTSYRQVLTFGDWPYAAQSSYVLGRSHSKNEDANITGFFDDIQNLMAELATMEYKNIWIMGGAATCQSFLNLGLINKMDLFVIPEFLNEGIKLFENFDASAYASELTLQSTKTYGNKIAQLSYELSKNQ